MAATATPYVLIKQCDNLEEVKEQVDQIATKVNKTNVGQLVCIGLNAFQSYLNSIENKKTTTTTDAGLKVYQGSQYYCFCIESYYARQKGPKGRTRKSTKFHYNSETPTTWRHGPESGTDMNKLADTGRIVVDVGGVYESSDVNYVELGSDGRTLKKDLITAFNAICDNGKGEDVLEATYGWIGNFALPSSKISD